MSVRPDLTEALGPGEVLAWRGHPKPGRRARLRANLIAAGLYAGSVLLAGLAFWLEIFRGHEPLWRFVVYLLVTAAAFCTYFGMHLTMRDRRRARDLDARTAYAITNRRVLSQVGPVRSELALGPGIVADLRGDTLRVEGDGTRLAFERLDDAAQARDILMARLEDSA